MSMRSPSRLLLALALLLGSPLAWAQDATPHDDGLEAQRERFRAGLEKYRAGAFADAIVIWENVYRELGPEKGYRLAFNLARAYEQFGDSTRAAESYEAYVRETARRRGAGETIEDVVEKQEREAQERLAELAATKGRIRIAGDRSVVVTIDGGAERLAPRTGFVAYVTPGRPHVVTFDPGTKDEHRIDVQVDLGQVVEVSPPPLEAIAPAPVAPAPLPSTRFEVREERPYDRSVLYVAAGVTAAAALVPVILYANASAVRSDYDAAREDASSASASDYRALANRADRLEADYESARSTAYASLAIPAALGVVTLGLAAYWLFATKERRVPMAGEMLPGGGAAVAIGRF
jgi:hypothetical protein